MFNNEYFFPAVKNANKFISDELNASTISSVTTSSVTEKLL